MRYYIRFRLRYLFHRPFEWQVWHTGYGLAWGRQWTLESARIRVEQAKKDLINA